MPTGDVFQFEAVFKSEINSVNLRRKSLGRPEITLEDEVFGDKPLTMSDGTTPLRPTEKSEVVGLALSRTHVCSMSCASAPTISPNRWSSRRRRQRC
jgi:hypothetical protein